jgi:hypothetical protein
MSFELDDSFRPPWWLRNRHLQSILPSLPHRRGALMRRTLPLIAASEELILDCGEGVRLHALHASPRRRGRVEGEHLAVLMHGWEGSAESLYILSLAHALFERGNEVVRLHLRDHGPSHHLNEGLFHSCLLPEVVGAMRRLRALFPRQTLHLGGFSLGGNFALRVAADPAAPELRIANVVAVSPVLDPAATLDALERGFGLYQRYFVWKWTRSLLKKQVAWPDRYEFSALIRTRNLRHMTAELVRAHTDFPSLEAYLNGYAIVGERLATLAAPATILTSLDDPIIPARDLERLARSDRLRIIVTRHGGHCGFLRAVGEASWADRVVLRELGN